MILDLLMAPIKLSLQVLEAIRKEVDKEMLNTVESVKRKMMELQLKYELNQISKREYEEAMKLLEERWRRLELETA